MGQSTRRLMMGAAGAAGGAAYVDDVFSNYVYKGPVTNNRIYNNIDLAGEGGLVWIKHRDTINNISEGHYLFDSERNYIQLTANSNDPQDSDNFAITVNNDGFNVSGHSRIGGSGQKFVSWTFRKQKGFFDVVTYTGNGTSGRTISHNLSSVPGLIMIKNLTDVEDWAVYHRSLGNTKFLYLNSHSTSITSSTIWNDTTPTESVFTVGDSNMVNGNGDSYVAYVFAHDEQIFGDNGDQSIIKCGSYVGNGSESNGTIVNLGWEPQWLLVKRRNGQDHWGIIDTMRGWTADGQGHVLFPNRNNAEDTNANSALPTSTGFQLHTTNTEWNENTETYIYMAIRRPDGYVGKPAEAGNEVFDMDQVGDWQSTPNFESSTVKVVDFALMKNINSQSDWFTPARLIQGSRVRTNTTDAAASYSTYQFDYQNGWANFGSVSANNYMSWMFKRHAGCDVVCYKGTASNRNINHSLNQTPEMIWVKSRSHTSNWAVYHKGLNGGTNPEQYYVVLNTSAAEAQHANFWNNTAPNSTTFRVGVIAEVNGFDRDMIAMLFSSVEGISKVGNFTNAGGTTTVSCGFQPRFVIAKAVNNSNWRVYDTVRGINAGSDPSMNLNTDDASQIHTSDDLNLTSTGFTIPTSSSNIGYPGNHIFYAHA